MGDKKMRVPVLRAYRRSPFDGLLAHASKINECLRALRSGIQAYLDEDYKEAERLISEVQKLEHEADLIKNNTRNHLPKFIFLPVDRADFLMLLREDDAVLDYAEDVAVLMKMRRTRVPEDLKKDLLIFADKIVETGETMEKVVLQLQDLLETSFSEQARRKTKKLIREVHKLEYEADRMQEKITSALLNSELDPISVMHLMRIIERLGGVADAAENSVDRVRVMMGK